MTNIFELPTNKQYQTSYFKTHLSVICSKKSLTASESSSSVCVFKGLVCTDSKLLQRFKEMLIKSRVVSFYMCLLIFRRKKVVYKRLIHESCAKSFRPINVSFTFRALRVLLRHATASLGGCAHGRRLNVEVKCLCN